MKKHIIIFQIAILTVGSASSNASLWNLIPKAKTAGKVEQTMLLGNARILRAALRADLTQKAETAYSKLKGTSLLKLRSSDENVRDFYSKIEAVLKNNTLSYEEKVSNVRGTIFSDDLVREDLYSENAFLSDSLSELFSYGRNGSDDELSERIVEEFLELGNQRSVEDLVAMEIYRMDYQKFEQGARLNVSMSKEQFETLLKFSSSLDRTQFAEVGRLGPFLILNNQSEYDDFIETIEKLKKSGIKEEIGGFNIGPGLADLILSFMENLVEDLERSARDLGNSMDALGEIQIPPQGAQQALENAPPVSTTQSKAQATSQSAKDTGKPAHDRMFGHPFVY